MLWKNLIVIIIKIVRERVRRNNVVNIFLIQIVQKPNHAFSIDTVFSKFPIFNAFIFTVAGQFEPTMHFYLVG